ncbi:family 76 glycosyl hydrolase [Microdochium trichocladiopsis]|uniref:Mannan endo-1,6-alpha-mannosidase n=1 Tax=Microdochium trichocladiopsis TaxID=1682393 RepID=A0A9P9BME5_9PEZI|nr:family 76 glycosyl hydrolase [Microdochium trichocladiopsis]KAH7025766.1 family 76 glycosyl hydrolase [Microdochium trichocladiopsis]
MACKAATKSCAATVCAVLLGLAGLTDAAQYYQIDSVDDIKTSAKTLAYDLMLNYNGNESGQVPGILPGPPPAGPYYWWEGGALWGAMMDYWHYTGDDTYNDVVMQGMLFQTGPNNDYMPPNWTASLGNDDQAFWGMSAMQAAEQNFPNPPKGSPGWLALAQAVFNTQAEPDRHDKTCGGGLRWQIPWYNNGYDYKNSIANGCFFNLGARLARYLNNQTAAQWADETWNWMESVGFISKDNRVFDGAHVGTNCTDINKAQFSYNNAILLLGAAHMYNWTSASSAHDNNSTPELWETRITNLLNGTIRDFFPNGIAYEASCEPIMSCTTDMLSFKGYTARWLTQMTQLAPFTASTILPILQTSAKAAVAQCTGGSTGRECGFQWSSGKFDGSVGAGQTMDVLGAVSSLLVQQGAAPEAPLTSSDGGTSPSDPSAGSTSVHLSDPASSADLPVTTGDRAGAGIATVVFVALMAAIYAWMMESAQRISRPSSSYQDAGLHIPCRLPILL